MQVITLHKHNYRLFSSLRTQDCLDNYRQHFQKQIDLYERLKAEKVSPELRKELKCVSTANYYRIKKKLSDLNKRIMPPSKRPRKVRVRLWGKSEIKLVLMLRRQNPTYGKQKIAVILRRDHKQTMSESTVGRILAFLKKKGLIQKSLSSVRPKRKNRFKGHAKPLRYKDYNIMQLGECVQVDHMSVTKNGIHFKHFQGYERKSKHIFAELYPNATSKSAKKFLLEFIKKAPYRIMSIQVDGGSEFMAEFEDACAELGIPLFVLPPKRPTLNGGVERGNRIFREEFYNRTNLLADSLGAMRLELEMALKKYNEYRPHGALKGDTPLSYICSNLSGALHSHIN